jgi:hypothetical protein
MGREHGCLRPFLYSLLRFVFKVFVRVLSAVKLARLCRRLLLTLELSLRIMASSYLWAHAGGSLGKLATDADFNFRCF